MTSEQVLQYCLSGLTVGSVYAIVAIGFNIIYNATGIINFAQGEFLVIGAMTAISLCHHVPLAVAILAAVVVTAAVGFLIDFLFIKWIKEANVLRLIVMTIGISIVLREAVLHVWDEKVRALPFFSGNEVSSILIEIPSLLFLPGLSARISPQVLWVLGISAILVIGLTLFFKLTLTGRAMRACACNRDAARLSGINARRMVTYSFMLSAAIGAVAGCVISPITQTQYDMGAPLAIKGFTVAVLGGLGNSFAAVAAGILLGLLETFSIAILPTAYTDAVSIAILLMVLSLRPTGLFSREEVPR